jgi:hypothetical protein
MDRLDLPNLLRRLPEQLHTSPATGERLPEAHMALIDR